MIIGQPEHRIEGVDVFLDPFHDVVVEVFAHPKFDIDQAVIIIEMLVFTDVDAQALDGRLHPFLDDTDAAALVILSNVHQLADRKQHHHDLLR